MKYRYKTRSMHSIKWRRMIRLEAISVFMYRDLAFQVWFGFHSLFRSTVCCLSFTSVKTNYQRFPNRTNQLISYNSITRAKKRAQNLFLNFCAKKKTLGSEFESLFFSRVFSYFFSLCSPVSMMVGFSIWSFRGIVSQLLKIKGYVGFCRAWRGG